MDERRLEIKVGALLLVAIVGVLGLLYLMGELSFRRGAEVFVDFSHTGNVVKGAPVKVGGVEVGRVDEVALLADRRDAEGRPLPVQLRLTISEEVLAALHDDARVTVSSVGPLGEPYLELSTGRAGRPALAPRRAPARRRRAEARPRRRSALVVPRRRRARCWRRTRRRSAPWW